MTTSDPPLLDRHPEVHSIHDYPNGYCFRFDHDGRQIEQHVTLTVTAAERRLNTYGRADGLTWDEAEAVYLLHGDYSGRTVVSLNDDRTCSVVTQGASE